MDNIQEKIDALRQNRAAYATAINLLQAQMADADREIQALEAPVEPEFAGPYTLENRPEDREYCLFIRTRPEGLTIDREQFLNLTMDLERLACGWIFPDTPAGAIGAFIRAQELKANG